MNASLGTRLARWSRRNFRNVYSFLILFLFKKIYKKKIGVSNQTDLQRKYFVVDALNSDFFESSKCIDALLIVRDLQ